MAHRLWLSHFPAWWGNGDLRAITLKERLLNTFWRTGQIIWTALWNPGACLADWIPAGFGGIWVKGCFLIPPYRLAMAPEALEPYALRYTTNTLWPLSPGKIPPAIRNLNGFSDRWKVFPWRQLGGRPLVCYLNRPLLFDRDGALQATTLPEPSEAYTLFLLDTGMPRKTGPLVQVFKDWCADPNYLARVMAELIPSTEDAIHYFLAGQWEALFEEWHILSGFQRRYMGKMILPAWETFWLEGLAGNRFKLKLCGAGGGGFVLGISKDWEQTQARFRDYRPMELRW
ncbi:MAG: hypothetical protein IPH16_02455 [Haliscomenobacter sp.]|nr:hypothetical protein [Haliscomenobacter sp.]